ncbi:GAF domain-containing protein [Usitatibacter palustris]|uniref:GAF domain-containing protein n=1 Tax=Usitatibacter palustris TaxID=2732487 RepID=A0A6M4H4K7_9PROT|nr:GAF domain-containing protein [Usitatibacter palustris]QJR14561.1 hypothetical protein DSM104440_01362 [Usitatibacter palustris]
MSEPTVKRISAYLRMAGLESLVGREADIELAIHDLVSAMAGAVEVEDPAALYAYPVPMLSEDGSCSIVDQLAPVPYNLIGILGGRSEQTTRRLAMLRRLVARAQETTGADWIGIYQARKNSAGVPVLVKLAYLGRPSRAEFPLTHEFAASSTNSTVGLTGRATVIEDVRRHVASGGSFYVCDADVQSEACVPILSETHEVAGIIDAESREGGFFGAKRLTVLAALALVAPAVLP